MIALAPTLESELVRCETFNTRADFDYLREIIIQNPEPGYTTEQLVDATLKSGRYFWTVRIDGQRRGVVYILQLGDKYILEALKDKTLTGRTGLQISLAVGRMVLGFMAGITDTIYTCARPQDKAIQALCHKLGFKVLGNRNQEIIVYRREETK